MDTMQINIQFGYQIDMEASDLKTGKIAFKKIESKYPFSVRMIEGRDWAIGGDSIVHLPTHFNRLSNLSSIKRADAFLSMMQLVELRDAWNRVDGFVADWENYETEKYVISFSRNKISIYSCVIDYRPIYFGSKETAELFLETFGDLIESAKELL